MFAFSYAPQSLVHWEMYFANDEPFTPVRPEMSLPLLTRGYFTFCHCWRTATDAAENLTRILALPRWGGRRRKCKTSKKNDAPLSSPLDICARTTMTPATLPLAPAVTCIPPTLQLMATDSQPKTKQHNPGKELLPPARSVR